jgi:hypothetical protein
MTPTSDFSGSMISSCALASAAAMAPMDYKENKKPWDDYKENKKHGTIASVSVGPKCHHPSRAYRFQPSRVG